LTAQRIKMELPVINPGIKCKQVGRNGLYFTQ
jgi:hypothetical protein